MVFLPDFVVNEITAELLKLHSTMRDISRMHVLKVTCSVFRAVL